MTLHAARQLPAWLIYDVSQNMKRVYVIVPIILVACFAVYAYWWSEVKQARVTAEEEAVRRARNAAITALFDGSVFVGRDGKKEALADISRGVPKLLLYGRSTADIKELAEILKERFGVLVDPLAGCIVSTPLVTFADAYNAEVRRFITEKFGHTSLSEAEREASARWAKKKAAKG